MARWIHARNHLWRFCQQITCMASYQQNFFSRSSVLGGISVLVFVCNGFIQLQSSQYPNMTSAGIMAPPIHAETALRIFSLSHVEGKNLGTVHSSKSIKFLCEVFPPLFRFHEFLFDTRFDTKVQLLRTQVHNLLIVSVRMLTVSYI